AILQAPQIGLDILQSHRLPCQHLPVLTDQEAEKALQRRLVKPGLAAELLVEAEPVEPGLSHQRGQMRTLVAKAPEQLHGLVQNLFTHISTGSRHFRLIVLLSIDRTHSPGY